MKFDIPNQKAFNALLRIPTADATDPARKQRRKSHRVRSYRRKDGTCVSSHYRKG